jgi:hypothetical protein
VIALASSGQRGERTDALGAADALNAQVLPMEINFHDVKTLPRMASHPHTAAGTAVACCPADVLFAIAIVALARRQHEKSTSCYTYDPEKGHY